MSKVEDGLFFLATFGRGGADFKTTSKPIIATVVAAVLVLAAGPTRAVTIEGVAFASQVEVDGKRLELRGAGLLRYLVFVKAYVGALYLPADVPSKEALGPVPRRLELSYFHAIEAEDFAVATRRKIADNIDPQRQQALGPKIERLNALYRDVQPGDRYSLTYRPGLGTALSLNGRTLGTIPGEAFAAAVFAIWLGRDPIDASFRDVLLGGP